MQVDLNLRILKTRHISNSSLLYMCRCTSKAQTRKSRFLGAPCCYVDVAISSLCRFMPRSCLAVALDRRQCKTNGVPFPFIIIQRAFDSFCFIRPMTNPHTHRVICTRKDIMWGKSTFWNDSSKIKP